MKKSVKIGIVVSIIVAVLIGGFIIYKIFFDKEDTRQQVSVVDNIEAYGYTLDDNETELYRKLFHELKDILSKEEVDFETYAVIVAKLFVADFYTLQNKLTKNDIGGTQFIHKSAKENFSLKASDTFYKYLENNLDGKRKSKYPIVTSFTKEEVKKVTFSMTEEVDAYQVTLTWDYNEKTEYQKEAILILVAEDKKLSIVEVKKLEV